MGHSRVVGVHGSLGVGKSSFLHKLREMLRGDGHPVAYVHLTADSEGTLYRELLAELLVVIQAGELKLKRVSGFDVTQEAERLLASVSESRGSNFGGKLLGTLGGDIKEDRTRQVPSHDEASARAVIRTVFGALKAPLVVILDDFEKLKYESSGKIRDYFPILSRFIGTLEEALNHEYVSFVVSMDNDVKRHIEQHRKDGGAFVFALNSLCELPNLTLGDLYEFIRVRLAAYGWEGDVWDFLSRDAFLALAIASGNHPRRVVRIVAEAMRIVAESALPRKIETDTMRQAAANTRYDVDEKLWLVADHIRNGGEGSAADQALRECLGYKEPRRADGYSQSVYRRLYELADRLRLSFDEVQVGNTHKLVLKLPGSLRDC